VEKREAALLLDDVHIGSGVAETDTLLESARVETSVFTDLWEDRVDLVLGTKGSGNTALYRIFVDFLPDALLASRKVVIAHGVRQREDIAFQEYNKRFDGLSEAEFTDFWCIYIISLASEQFLRSPKYQCFLQYCGE
jgi:hypothetical protein